MLYRRKLLLYSIQRISYIAEKTRLQIAIFLLSQFQKKPSYSFFPYHYGAYSLVLANDLDLFFKENILKWDNGYILVKEYDVSDHIKPDDYKALNKVIEILKEFNNINELLKYVYKQFPYYAARRINHHQIVQEQLELAISVNKFDTPTVYTIGYEGIEIEDYINKLIRAGVKSVIDSRINPVSMKYFFNKNELERNLKAARIRYYHLPGLGIPSSLRKQYIPNNPDKLFDIYMNSILPNAQNELDRIKVILEKDKYIAVTCFEKDEAMCHRSRISNYLCQQWNIHEAHLK